MTAKALALSLMIATSGSTALAAKDWRSSIDCSLLFAPGANKQIEQEYKKKVGENIRQLIQRQPAASRPTFSELANYLGITISAMSHKLNGRSPITLVEALKLARYFKVQVLSIFDPEFENSVSQATAEISIENIKNASIVIGEVYTAMIENSEHLEMAVGVAELLGTKTASRDEITVALKTYILAKLRRKP